VNVEPHLITEPEVTEALRGRSLARVVVELTEHTQAPDSNALERALTAVRRGPAAWSPSTTPAPATPGLQQMLTVRP
jgi:hypothetical protein